MRTSKILIACFSLLLGGVSLAQPPGAAPPATPAAASGLSSDPRASGLGTPEEKHLRNVRQLTFGGSNAEAYFSADGKKIIFQSTRDSLQCDQIFMMNADGSDQKMVSTGKGRTTCGYIFPHNDKILYSSTHLARRGLPAAPGLFEGICVGGVSGLRYFYSEDGWVGSEAVHHDSRATMRRRRYRRMERRLSSLPCATATSIFIRWMRTASM